MNGNVGSGPNNGGLHFDQHQNKENVTQLSQLIRLKERELHEFHDLRCGQLEKLVEERDQLIINAHNRFEQLKEDFSYNLTLLGARDQEIDRLESIAEARCKDLADSEGERRSLAGRLEILELRDVDRVERHNQDKIATKVLKFIHSFN